MVKNFITKLKDSFKEFKKRDIIICAVALAAILIGVGIYTLSPPDDAPTLSPGKDDSSVPAPSSEIEQKLESILAKISGAGNVDVLITYRDTAVNAEDKSDIIPQTLGAVILADGADDLGVRIQIQQAVQTALGIEANQVKIFKTGNSSQE